ncbi:Uncharacterized protein Fot_16758 [Forsythia ovata]|uniref:Uncharacterized protein n=1 Tax=Forsythia ovata TaxID=205694 RepID=A0ABD1VDH3_9LAMI
MFLRTSSSKRPRNRKENRFFVGSKLRNKDRFKLVGRVEIGECGVGKLVLNGDGGGDFWRCGGREFQGFWVVEFTGDPPLMTCVKRWWWVGGQFKIKQLLILDCLPADTSAGGQGYLAHKGQEIRTLYCVVIEKLIIDKQEKFFLTGIDMAHVFEE